GHQHAVLGPGETRVAQVAHGGHGGVERTLAAHGVVDLRRGAVQGELDVDVVGPGQPTRAFGRDAHAVGRELDADLVVDGVLDDLPEVRTHGRFAAPDVHVEHLQALEFVDDRLAFLCGQFTGIAAAGGGQAVHAREIAGVGQFPRQADRCVESVLEM